MICEENFSNLNSDLMKTNPNYVVRIVSDEGDIGRGYLGKFMDIEIKQDTPIMVTTSQLLTTGVDVPLCKNIALFRVVNSMTDFKQMIGRGTRGTGGRGAGGAGSGGRRRPRWIATLRLATFLPSGTIPAATVVLASGALPAAVRTPRQPRPGRRGPARSGRAPSAAPRPDQTREC